jgi:preprotein translocase subunit SecA
MAQRDPLVKYQHEGFTLFEAMNEAIKEESIGYLFNVEIEVNPEEAQDVQDDVEAPPIDGFEAAKAIRAKGLETPNVPAHLHYSAPSDDYSVEEHDQVSDETRASRKAQDPRGGSKKSRAKQRNKRR